MDTYMSKQTVLNELIEWKQSCAETGHHETASDLKLIISSFEKMQSDLITCQNCRYWRLNYYQDIETCSEHRNVDGTEQATPPDFFCGWWKERNDEEDLFEKETQKTNPSALASTQTAATIQTEESEEDECTNCATYNFCKNGIHAKCPITGCFDDCEKLRIEDAEQWK